MNLRLFFIFSILWVLSAKGTVVLTTWTYQDQDLTCQGTVIRFSSRQDITTTNCASLQMPENTLGPCQKDIAGRNTQKFCNTNAIYPPVGSPVGQWSLSSSFQNTACSGQPTFFDGTLIDTCFQNGAKFTKNSCSSTSFITTDYLDSSCSKLASSPFRIDLGCKTDSTSSPQSSFKTCTAFTSNAGILSPHLLLILISIVFYFH